MKSMTGYAYSESSNEGITVSVEIKSYNNRFLDLQIHLPPWLSVLEGEIKKNVGRRIGRGKVEVSVRIKEENPLVSVTVNDKAALAYYNAIKKLIKTLSLDDEPDIGMILGIEGVLETETKREADRYLKVLLPELNAAMEKFDAERIREGEHTKEDILSHISIIEESLGKISSCAPELEAAIKDNLKTRFLELLGDRIDENRILAETAVLLMKYSISEELSRLSSHLGEFRLEMKKNPSPGKKLDFLSQEINREMNTIGSKTPMIEVTRAVVEMKNALENVREQLRNVE